MNKWGDESHRQRSTCDIRLNLIGDIVLQLKDHSVIKGHRTRDEQDTAFLLGNSKLRWPHGKHNKKPSIAVDVRAWPWPEDEQDQREEQLYLLGLYKGVGHMKGVRLRVGGDWDRDGEIADNGFDDLFHIEIDE